MNTIRKLPYKAYRRGRRKGIRWVLLCGIILLLIVLVGYWYVRFRASIYDLVIINAVIHDGSKAGEGVEGALGIRGARISKIWKGRLWIKPRAKEVIDAGGMDLAPGFIDTHSHADLSISAGGYGKIRADNFIGQGITTVIVGNCGRSHADIPAFAQNLAKRKSNINIATLIGLNAVRKKVMQESSSSASASEINRMCEMIRSGMKAGALGVSTGLEYPPGIFASRTEIIAQLKTAREFGGIHTTHMRSEGGEIIKAVEEVIDYSQAADIPLLISHYKITGLKNCNQFDTLKKLIAQARAKGLKIYVDYYPYNASSTNLNIFLPDWYLALNRKEKSKFLTTHAGRAKLKEGIKEVVNHEGFYDLKFAKVAYYSPHREWQGKSLDQIDLLYRKVPSSTMDTQLNIFVEMESHGGAQMIYHNICPDVLERIPKEEENMIGTDSAIRYDNGESLPHPRGWGAFPRFIRYFVREKKMLSLDEAIYRMSGLPATVFQLENRGRIQNNYYADLVIFDSKTISDGATYENPFQPPVGIKYVLVNGKVVTRNEPANNAHEVKHNSIILDVYPGVFIKKG